MPNLLFLSLSDTLRTLYVLRQLESRLDDGQPIKPDSTLHQNLNSFISGLQCHLLDSGIDPDTDWLTVTD